MRKYIIAFLLAGAAASPALAQDQEQGRWHRDRDQEQSNDSARHQQREDRSQQPDRQQQFEARQQQVEARQQQFDAREQQHLSEVRQQQIDAVERHAQRADGVSRWTRDNNQRAGETGRWTRDPEQRAGETGRWTRDRSGWNREAGDLRQGDRPAPYVMQTRNPLAVDGNRRTGTRDELRSRSRWASGGWNRDWRNNSRYDWRRYRDHHRSAFHLGVYLDPFGFGYRPFNIGYNLGPAYYSQQYWIDPQMYSLPYPPPGTQWVRYWNDALLVDVYSGEIVDVIQNFFW